MPRPSALAYDYDEIIDALEGDEDGAVDDAGEDYETIYIHPSPIHLTLYDTVTD